MRGKYFFISVFIHGALIALTILIVFDVPSELITLGYGNVEFSFTEKPKQKNRNKAKESKQYAGYGESVAESALEKERSFEENKETENISNGKFSIDFLGKRSRAIYSYVLPDYPEGVEKEVDIVMKITIEPDGTISKIFPLIKADTRLEITAIDALRNWRFEPLPKEMPQLQQEAVVVFPYKLR